MTRTTPMLLPRVRVWAARCALPLPAAGGALRRVHHIPGVDVSKPLPGTVGSHPGFGRTLAAVLAGGLVMFAWVRVRPRVLSPPTLPGSGLITLAAGLMTFRYVAPGASFLAFVGGVIVLVPIAFVVAAVSALAIVDTQVHISRHDRAALTREVESLVERAESGHPHGKFECVDSMVDALIPVMKMVFYAMCDPADVDPETGALVLTRRRIEELREKPVMGAELQCDPDDAKCRAAVAKFISLFDLDRNDKVTFVEFASGMMCLLFADEQNTRLRTDMWFRSLDLDNNGVITRDELVFWVRAMMQAGAVSAQDRVVGAGLLEQRPRSAEEIADLWMKRYDVDGDGGISREEFGAMCDAVNFSPVVPSRDWVDVVRVRL